MKTYRNPKPMPTPAPGGSDTVKIPRPPVKKSPKPGTRNFYGEKSYVKMNPKPTPKPKPKKSQVSDEEIMPKKFPKPKGNRRRLLDATNKMNKEAGY